MKIAVLAKSSSWYFNDLERAVGQRHEIFALDFHQLQAHVGEQPWAGIKHEKIDCVLVRSMPPGSLEQVIFRMDVLARWQAAGTRIVNRPKSLEAAIDKYLSLSLLQSAGIAVPETRVCQTVDAAMDGFAELGGDVVIKPVFGGEGRGLTRVSDIELAYRAFTSLAALGQIIYLQQTIDHGNQDYRLMVIGKRVFGMKRTNAKDWRTNASRGAICEPWQVSQSHVDLALAATESIGVEIAGVDLLCDSTGKEFIVEVNAVPGWRKLASANQLDIASEVIEYLAGTA